MNLLMAYTNEANNLRGASDDAPDRPINSSGDMGNGHGEGRRLGRNVLCRKLCQVNYTFGHI